MAKDYFERLVAEEQRREPDRRRETIRQKRAASPVEQSQRERGQLRQALGRLLLRVGTALLPLPELECLAQTWRGKEQRA